MSSLKFELPDPPGLYKLQRDDVPKAMEMLGQAFREDPIWKEIMKHEPEKFPLTFGVPVKYTLKYGKIFAPSSDINACAVWLATPYIDPSFWRLLWSGAIWPAFKLGGEIGKKINQVFKVITEDRHKFMEGKYVYLYVIGVSPQFQGQGIGTHLVKSMLDQLPPDVPVYLETETEQNVKFYEKLGFNVLNERKVPLLNLPMWEMVYSRSE